VTVLARQTPKHNLLLGHPGMTDRLVYAPDEALFVAQLKRLLLDRQGGGHKVRLT
jgi:hypothetical protein